nr:hypothetical protein [Deltaproteobacteria bacterium]
MDNQKKNTNRIRETREGKIRAMQANLLALNALFEAARVGKKGFGLAEATEKVGLFDSWWSKTAENPE